jgi:hypothetical protein
MSARFGGLSEKRAVIDRPYSRQKIPKNVCISGGPVLVSFLVPFNRLMGTMPQQVGQRIYGDI